MPFAFIIKGGAAVFVDIAGDLDADAMPFQQVANQAGADRDTLQPGIPAQFLGGLFQFRKIVVLGL